MTGSFPMGCIFVQFTARGVMLEGSKLSSCSPRWTRASLVPRLLDLFNIAREKRRSLVKLITCVTSGGTNFHIRYNSKLAKIKATDAKSLSSSISMLQLAMNQQAETLQSLFYESKTAICMVT